jgi:hypothetical protein
MNDFKEHTEAREKTLNKHKFFSSRHNKSKCRLELNSNSTSHQKIKGKTKWNIMMHCMKKIHIYCFNKYLPYLFIKRDPVSSSELISENDSPIIKLKWFIVFSNIDRNLFYYKHHHYILIFILSWNFSLFCKNKLFDFPP